VSRWRLGPSATRGRFERAFDAAFTLHPDVPAPGALPIADAKARVYADWDRQADEGRVTRLSVLRLKVEVDKLERYAAARGAVELCDIDTSMCLAWVRAPLSRPRNNPTAPLRYPAYGTQHVRRAAERALFGTCRLLGLQDGDPSSDITLPPKPRRFTRPLDELEIDACKTAARFSPTETRGPATLALALTGATTGEIPHLTVGDLHLEARLLWVHTDNARSNRARWSTLDDYAYTALSRHLWKLGARPDHHLPADLPLVFQGDTAADNAYRTATASNTIIRILKRAGLHGQDGVRPTSITEYVAAAIYEETGRIEAVAARLGMYSLDATADMLGLEWMTGLLVPGPDGTVPAVVDGRDDHAMGRVTP
jgi:integrase